MANPLVPSISGTQISMHALLSDPRRLNGLIARLTAEQLVVDAFFRPATGAVTGGGMLYDVLLHGGNFLAAGRDVQSRTPGAEYVVSTSDLVRDMAVPQDHGARIQILDEERVRYDPAVIANRLAQLANSIARRIDALAVAAVDAALAKYEIVGVPGHNWDNLVTVGPLTDITPSASRPTADLANAALLIRADDLGIKPADTLVCHPQQLAALQIGYGPELTDALAAVGITDTRTSMQVANGTAYVVASGAAGVLGFEPATVDATTGGAASSGGGLVTELIPDREHRATWIQSYAVPCFACPVPGAIRKITGLAG